MLEIEPLSLAQIDEILEKRLRLDRLVSETRLEEMKLRAREAQEAAEREAAEKAKIFDVERIDISKASACAVN